MPATVLVVDDDRDLTRLMSKFLKLEGFDAAEAGMVLLIDGFIVTSALLVAFRLEPAIRDYCVFAHRSEEAGHRGQLDHLKVEPLLDLGLRLGEGTGAALGINLIEASVKLYREMATFESAGVSKA